MNESFDEHVKVWEDFLNALTPRSKIDVGKIQTLTGFLEWAGQNGIVDPLELWQAREDSRIPQVEIEPENVKSEEQPESGARALHQRHVHYHLPKHEAFTKAVEERAKKEAGKWEEKPNSTAKSRDEAYRKSHERSYDNLVEHYPGIAEEWRKKHNDQHVISALTRKAEREELKARQKAIQRSQRVTIWRPIPSPLRRSTPSAAPVSRAGSLGGLNRLAGRRVNKRKAAGEARKIGKDLKTGAALLTGGASAVATSRFGKWVTIGAVALVGIVLFVFVAIVFAAGCVIVNNPIGSAIGVNYCSGGGSGVAVIPSLSPGITTAPLSCSQVPGVCKASCGEQEIQAPSATCTTGICCVRESAPTKNSSEIASWARQLTNSLGKGNNNLYNVLLQPVFGRITVPAQRGFLCTDLAIYSYRLAGVRGPSSASTCTQAQRWRSLGSGYEIAQKDVDVRRIKKGDLLWWWSYAPNQWGGSFCGGPGLNHFTHHTNVISEITITDAANGVGYMKSLDANSYRKEFVYPIRNWRVVSWPGYSRLFDGFWVGIAP
jgi:hypothetical protein